MTCNHGSYLGKHLFGRNACGFTRFEIGNTARDFLIPCSGDLLGGLRKHFDHKTTEHASVFPRLTLSR